MRSRRLLLGGAALLAASTALLAGAPAAALNALASIASLRVAEAQAYGTLPRQRFDLYRPAGSAPAGGWPLLVFFYGGSWNHGERADYRFVGEALAGRGMMAMVADYRLYPQVRYPDFLRDCAAALGHGLAQARGWGANAQRVFVMGHSAGAYNAAMLALDARWLAEAGRRPDELAGWIGLAGPYNFLPIRTPEVRPVFHHPEVPPDSQPIGHATASTLPVLLAAALRDDFVDPSRNTRLLADALRSAGAPVRLREYTRVDHLSLVGALAWPLRGLAPVLDDIEAFVAAARPASASLAR